MRIAFWDSLTVNRLPGAHLPEQEHLALTAAGEPEC